MNRKKIPLLPPRKGVFQGSTVPPAGEQGQKTEYKEQKHNTLTMAKTILTSDFNFPGQKGIYKGKVRDVYNINDKYLLMVVSDRLSAFDVVLPKGIPYKGQVLNQIASKFLDATSDLVPNWKIATPDPTVTIGHKCKPYPLEMIVRAYLTGSSWRTYKSGARELCGIPLPDGMKEHQRFPVPLITPTTKAEHGRHDEDISREEILKSGLLPENEYAVIEKYTMDVFLRGSEIAAQHGLILVDTKYEFGNKDGEIMLIDEINTPDSSRYFYADEYQERFDKGLPQKQLSKEFVREWLMENGFQGQEGQKVPEMSDEFVNQISARYIELYEKITGEMFVRADITNVRERIEKNCNKFLETLK
jgi:phosphoribosylaminoimidazole-succinocarboxamide synthase